MAKKIDGVYTELKRGRKECPNCKAIVGARAAKCPACDNEIAVGSRKAGRNSLTSFQEAVSIVSAFGGIKEFKAMGTKVALLGKEAKKKYNSVLRDLENAQEHISQQRKQLDELESQLK